MNFNKNTVLSHFELKKENKIVHNVFYMKC
jgi:hypothetical protein